MENILNANDYESDLYTNFDNSETKFSKSVFFDSSDGNNSESKANNSNPDEDDPTNLYDQQEKSESDNEDILMKEDGSANDFQESADADDDNCDNKDFKDRLHDLDRDIIFPSRYTEVDHSFDVNNSSSLASKICEQKRMIKNKKEIEEEEREKMQ